MPIEENFVAYTYYGDLLGILRWFNSGDHWAPEDDAQLGSFFVIRGQLMKDFTSP